MKYLISIFSLLFAGCGSDQYADQYANQMIIPNANTSGSTSTPSALVPEEQIVFDQINALRASLGLKALTVDPLVELAARGHSQYMDSISTLSHTEPAPNTASWDRIAKQGASFNASGETIACGNSGGANTFNQWLNSPGHYAIMVGSQYQFIGIARAGSAGPAICPWYWTADFTGN
jgi:uncharacterized protein YkwD